MATVDSISIPGVNTDAIYSSITSGDFDSADSWTIVCFVNHDTITGDRGIFQVAQEDASLQEYPVYFITNTTTQILYDDYGGSGNDIINTGFTASASTWYGWCLRASGTTWDVRRYDGSGSFQAAYTTMSNTPSHSFTQDHMTWGGRFDPVGDSFGFPSLDGNICLMGIWNSALSDADVNGWFSDPLNFGSQPNLVRLYEQDGTINVSGSTVTNNGSYGDFTLQGSAAYNSGGGVTVTDFSPFSPSLMASKRKYFQLKAS